MMNDPKFLSARWFQARRQSLRPMICLAVTSALPLAACVPNYGVVKPTPASELAWAEAVKAQQAAITKRECGVQLASSTPSDSYRLLPGDDIEIKFYNTPELNERQVIRPNGAVSLPLINSICAGGLTVDQFHQALIDAYTKSDLKGEPELYVAVRQATSRRIYVGGEVGQQGVLPLVTSTTAMQAILEAQGLKDTARANEILLVRVAPDGKSAWRVLNLEKTLAGEDPENQENPELQSGDLLYVPKKPISNVDEFVDLYIRRLLPISPNVGYNLQ